MKVNLDRNVIMKHNIIVTCIIICFFLIVPGTSYSQDTLEIRGSVYSGKKDFVSEFIHEVASRDSMSAEEIRKYIHFESERGAAYKKYGPGDKLNYHSLNPGKVNSLVFEYLKTCECISNISSDSDICVVESGDLDYAVKHDSLSEVIKVDLATVPRVLVDNLSCGNCSLKNYTSVNN